MERFVTRGATATLPPAAGGGGNGGIGGGGGIRDISGTGGSGGSGSGGGYEDISEDDDSDARTEEGAAGGRGPRPGLGRRIAARRAAVGSDFAWGYTKPRGDLFGGGNWRSRNIHVGLFIIRAS